MIAPLYVDETQPFIPYCDLGYMNRGAGDYWIMVAVPQFVSAPLLIGLIFVNRKIEKNVKMNINVNGKHKLTGKL